MDVDVDGVGAAVSLGGAGAGAGAERGMDELSLPGAAILDMVGGPDPWEVFGRARTLDLGLPGPELKPIIDGGAPLTLMLGGGARIGAARTPDGLESGGRP